MNLTSVDDNEPIVFKTNDVSGILCYEKSYFRNKKAFWIRSNICPTGQLLDLIREFMWRGNVLIVNPGRY